MKPIFTYLLIAVNVLVFLLTSNQPTITLWGANNPAAVLQSGAYYRLVTAMFLHADIAHLLFNLIALFSVGSLIENIFGHVHFVLLYILGGLAGSIASALLNEANTLSVGASGAVFALFGAEVFYYFKYGEGLDLRASVGAIALNLLNGLRPDSGIDNGAHVGGLIGGGIVAAVTSQFLAITYPESGGVSLKSTRQRGFLILAGASFTIVALLMVSAVSSLAPRTLTVDNITFTLPGSWQTSTNFEDVPLCQQPNFECLIVGTAGAEAIFEIQRYANINLFLDAQDDFESLAADETETITEIEVDGHDAIQRIIRIGDPTRYLLLIRDGDTVVRFYLEAPPADFDRYLDEIEPFVASIRFA
jgi:membrane associated rhomboid family serine protease